MREWVRLLTALALSTLPLPSAAAPAPELDVRTSCEPAQDPGRVRCDIELRARGEWRVAWADVLVISAPSAVRPLRSRVAAPAGADGVGRAALAVIASTTGAFPVGVRGRAVVCAGAPEHERCHPVTREGHVEVRVGG